jgi:hypothetical protein
MTYIQDNLYLESLRGGVPAHDEPLFLADMESFCIRRKI